MKPAIKRWFRPVAYSLIGLLVVLAAFADPLPEDPAAGFVRASDDGTRADSAAPPRPAAKASTDAPAVAPTTNPALRPRGEATFAIDLFAAPPPPPAPEPLAATEPVVAPMPELKVLGWYESDATPQVFVELAEETFALTPGLLAGDVYRFDAIGAGMARFTYLPTGATREFAVSDPAVSAE
jgi:hypothetical protein